MAPRSTCLSPYRNGGPGIVAGRPKGSQKDTMPYDSLTELPDSVRDNLPKHAQEIYQSAFNNAWDEYRNADDREGDASREETAHKVAWSAVKQSYEKRDGNWVKR